MSHSSAKGLKVAPSKCRTHHYELRTYEKHFTCDGCKMKGFGRRYQCNPCGKELHKECRYHKTEIKHDLFGCSTLTFLKKPFKRLNERSKTHEYSKCCDACGKEIRGFSYHCEADKLDLHPCCGNLEDKLVINDTVFNLVSKVSTTCMWCKKRKILDGDNNVPGWSYVSECGKYIFHVYCITEMVHEARMKHGNSKSALKRIDLKQLAKTKRNGRSRRTTKAIKLFLQVIASVLLGDPTGPTLSIADLVLELLMAGN